MATPLQLQLPQHGMDSEDSGPFLDFRALDPVLPSQLQYVAKAIEMEVVQLSVMACVDDPGSHYAQECRRDNDLLHLPFGVRLKAVSIPHGGLHPVKGLSGFGEPTHNLIVDVCITRECAP
nr:unnamed protein product [Spirometra erinaceieuropaei]